jgi:hypothetical protein
MVLADRPTTKSSTKIHRWRWFGRPKVARSKSFERVTRGSFEPAPPEIIEAYFIAA